MLTRRLIVAGLAALALAAATGCGEEESGLQGEAEEAARQEAPPETSGALKEKPRITVPKGPPPKKLEVEDLVEGKGGVAKAGSRASVNYLGVIYSTGRELDNSYDRGQPLDFALGTGEVLPGWDQGIEGMKVGGRRRLTIPADLAYGDQGSPPDIKPGETLIFVIDLLGVQ